MTCPFCGTSNDASAPYCSRCGVSLHSSGPKSFDVKAPAECPECGAPLHHGACPACSAEKEQVTLRAVAPARKSRMAALLGGFLVVAGIAAALLARLMMPSSVAVQLSAAETGVGFAAGLPQAAWQYVGAGGAVLVGIGVLVMVAAMLALKRAHATDSEGSTTA